MEYRLCRKIWPSMQNENDVGKYDVGSPYGKAVLQRIMIKYGLRVE
jgi:hypothetical protein